LQQNSNDNQLRAPTKEDSGNLEWKFQMIELFKSGKISEARKLICGKLRAEEIEDVFRWLYDNVTVFGNETVQDAAILIIKQGMVDHTLISDPEINLAATMIKLSRLNK
jgi:hypothetical protein